MPQKSFVKVNRQVGSSGYAMVLRRVDDGQCFVETECSCEGEEQCQQEMLVKHSIQYSGFELMQENRPVSSQQIYLQEKVCIFDNNDDVAIYDQDLPQEQRLESERELFKNVENVQTDNILLQKIDQEIKCSKENFFNVKVVKEVKNEVRPKKMLKSEQMNKLATKSKGQSNLIIREGFLEKKYDSNIIFKWTKRYFALNSQKLYCFEDRTKDKPIACVNFKRLPAQLRATGKCEIEVDFLGQCQNLILKADSEKQIKGWVDALKSVIQLHCLEAKTLFKTLSKGLYQERDSLTEKEFIEQSETGDILLFFTDHTGGKIQRFLTQSQYDHVAMIVKFDKKEAMVFEANQLSGVALYDWKYYIHYFDLYQKVAIRKLRCVWKQQLHSKLLAFIKRHLGRKYDLSALKLFKQESNFDWSNLDEQRGFFCSELIAKAYKSVGLLQPKRASSKYWPVDFSEKSDLSLKQGAVLDRQQLIVLNKHLKKRL